MFPHVTTQQRGLTKAERVYPVLGLGDLEAAIGVLHQPAPARAELTGTRSSEIFLELVERAKALGDRLFQLAGHAGAAGGHHLPELVVVPVLRGVVEDTRLRDGLGIIGTLDDLFDRLALPLGAGDGLVAVVDIGLVVDVVVVFQRLTAHAVISERIVRIRKVGKFESHGYAPCSLVLKSDALTWWADWAKVNPAGRSFSVGIDGVQP